MNEIEDRIERPGTRFIASRIVKGMKLCVTSFTHRGQRYEAGRT